MSLAAALNGQAWWNPSCLKSSTAWITKLFIFCLLCFLPTSCSYVPHSDTEWTPEMARKVILDWQLDWFRFRSQGESPLDGQRGITETSFSVTDEGFTDYYVASVKHYGRATVTTYKLRWIKFCDVDLVYMRWNKVAGIIAPFFTFGIAGPYVYELEMKLRNGAKVIGLDGEETDCLPIHEPRDRWAWLDVFPFWIVQIRPFVHSNDLGEAINFMAERARATRGDNVKASAGTQPLQPARKPAPAPDNSKRTEDVDWKNFRARRVEMTVDQAIQTVKSSLEAMGRQLEQSVAKQGGTFVLERVDRLGFAFKLEMVQRQGNVTMKAAVPKAINFKDVTKLGIKKLGSGQETDVVLLMGKEGLWELPFSNAAERDKLLSALAVLCENLSTK